MVRYYQSVKTMEAIVMSEGINSALMIKEFDKKANEIRVMTQVHKWFGIIFEALMSIGAICIINIPIEFFEEDTSGIDLSFYMVLGGYMIFMIQMFIAPFVMIGNGKRTNIYNFLSYAPIKKSEIFLSRIKIVCKMMSVRIVIFEALELLVILCTRSFSVKAMALAVCFPFSTMIVGILYCMPHKNT